jgi:hypothetical protein
VAAPFHNRPFTQHITQRLCAHSPRSLDAPSQEQSGQTTRPTARAETHQNLIHSNKEHAGTKTSAPRSPAAQRNRRSRPKGSKTNRADLSVFSVTIGPAEFADPSGGFPPRVCFAAAFRASARNRGKWR